MFSSKPTSAEATLAVAHDACHGMYVLMRTLLCIAASCDALLCNILQGTTVYCVKHTLSHLYSSACLSFLSQ